MPTDYGPVAIWGVAAVVGLATFAVRGSFVYLFGRIETVPPRVTRALRFVPPAVFAALVVPSLVVVDGSADLVPVAVSASASEGVSVAVGNERLLAGLVAAGAAWVTEDVFATIAAGMLTLWFLRFVV
ncbi:AzlD domain-containing protein [Halogeometricum sp. S1BR25-6]|uniref:AzlD domain-containing protein n=1 Tax=Halogeometricum salsisoli TaxID=2950536 RepID=A0ABU2GGB4_9EURY|nr:AzlD domain-containing protein [Halogeometricum sp. S1BR25-6]MDS0299819.1 AzlD domain-containing protein [Halogeometricum sp. S1BR25-6]